MHIKLSLNEEISKIKSQMYFTEETIPHIYQPTGNSCGPTCIKMVGDFIKGDVGKIDDICNSCGTDWVVGTPPDRMRKGLDQLHINYTEHVHEIEPYQSLRNVIDKNNVLGYGVNTILKEYIKKAYLNQDGVFEDYDDAGALLPVGLFLRCIYKSEKDSGNKYSYFQHSYLPQNKSNLNIGES